MNPRAVSVLAPELVSYDGYEPGTLLFDHPPSGQRASVLRRSSSAVRSVAADSPEPSCGVERTASRASALSQHARIARKIRPGQTIALAESPGVAASCAINRSARREMVRATCR